MKWNPRGFDARACSEKLLQQPERVWCIEREGKRSLFAELDIATHALLPLPSKAESLIDACCQALNKLPAPEDETAIQTPADRPGLRLRRVIELTERTIDRHGQTLLEPQLDLSGWTTTLTDAPHVIRRLYQQHGTHEQFHSEFKTDLDLERLPSSTFAVNDVVMSLGMIAFNILRHIGQNTLLGPSTRPGRDPLKRRRIKTVIQDMVLRAARLVQHARQLVLGLGLHDPSAAAMIRHFYAIRAG